MRRLAEAVLPFFRRALLRLEEPRSLLAIAGEWATLAQTLAREGLEAEAGIVISKMEDLLSDVERRPEAAGPLREGLTAVRRRGAAAQQPAR